MIGIILFLFGILVGATFMWWTQLAAHHHGSRVDFFDTQYGPAKRVVLRELRAHGTINLKQLERLLDATAPHAGRFLHQMVTDGLIVRQGHHNDGAFYTPVVR